MVPTKHALGWGNGKIIEYEDGSAGYIPTQSFTQAFRVQIADVTGFSVTKGGKMLQRTFNVLGNGTLLGSVDVNHGTSELIENWFRSHPLFAANAVPAGKNSATAATHSVADEIRKLGELKAQGLLTDAEFAAQKERLLSDR
jgi:hypothetical protein